MIDFSNGLEFYIKESDYLLEKLIKEFKKEILKGNHPNTVKEEVFKRMKIKEKDLTDSDIAILVNEVNKIYKNLTY